jgi:hypothetical protein
MQCLVCFGIFSSSAFSIEHGDHDLVVDITDEPNHRLVLNSQSVRVFDVQFPPNAMSLWHRHSKDSVLLCLEGADVPSEEPGEPITPRTPIPSGKIYFKDYGKNQFVHRIKNVSQHNFRIFDIEIIKPPSQKNQTNFWFDGGSNVIANDRVKVFGFLLKPNSSIVFKKSINPYIIVIESEGEALIEYKKSLFCKFKVNPGFIHIQEFADSGYLENIGNTNLKFTIIEVL